MADNDSNHTCPHCAQPLQKWQSPELGTWSAEYHLVCFNDDCQYFRKGWEWMFERFAARASYRFRLDPSTGEKGPVPVWSVDALKSGIIEDGTEQKGDTSNGQE